MDNKITHCKKCGKELSYEVFLDVYVNPYLEKGYCSKKCYESEKNEKSKTNNKI